MTEHITFFDSDLAHLLSRLASIQGVAMPAHRFGMMSVTSGGADVMELHRGLRAREWWSSAFPSAHIEEVEGQPTRANLPMLWVKHDGSLVLIVKSIHSDHSYGVEDESGAVSVLGESEASLGQLIVLRPVFQETNPKSKPRSAKDWFYYAIRKRISSFVEAIVATCVLSLLALGVSFYTMQVYDRVVPTESYQTLIVLTVGTMCAILFEFLMKHARSRLLDKACKSIDEELSSVFFGRVLDIRMDARPKSVGTFASQIKNFEMVRNFMTSSTLFLLADAPFALFFIFVIFTIGGSISLVPLALLPATILIGFYAKWKMGKLAEEQHHEVNHKNGLLVEAIDGIEAIKAVGGEWKMLDRWNSLTSITAEKELGIRSATNIATSLTQTVQQISYISLIAVGVYEIHAGNLTMGALMGCSIISNRALSPISQIAGMMVQWQNAKSALNSLDGIMGLPTDRNSDSRLVIPGSCDGQIKVEEVSFGYTEGTKTVDSINLVINPGDRIALIGPVGSGKSTFIKLLVGLYKPHEGRVFLDGVDMEHLPSEFLREHIGYLPQDVRLFQGTLKDNLIMGLSAPSDEQILVAASKTGLDKVIRAHPQGLGLPIYEGGRGLSGGQRQLVGLTRLLIAKPKIIVVDEPTASMDGDLEQLVMKGLFDSLSQDQIIVLATHKMSLLSLTKRVFILDRGRLVLDGETSKVLSSASSVKAGGASGVVSASSSSVSSLAKLT